jgi:hypothetical protein
MSRIARYPYVAGLEPFLNLPPPSPSPPPAPPRRGRRKALGTVRPVTELLVDIAEVSSPGNSENNARPSTSKITHIARRLQKRSEYRKLSERTLRRDVAKVLLLLVDPIPGCSKKELRKQALELMWNTRRGITHPN